MKKVLFFFILTSISFSIYCENVNYVELLNSIPTRIGLENSLFNKYLGNDDILNKFKRTNHQMFEIKNKYINENFGVITLLMCESQRVGNRAFLISFSNEGQIIDEKKIMNAFDGDDLSKSSFGYTYSLTDKQIKIKYVKSTPISNYHNKKTMKDSNL